MFNVRLALTFNRRESGVKGRGFGCWLQGMSWDGQFGRSCAEARKENRVLEALKNLIFEEGTQ